MDRSTNVHSLAQLVAQADRCSHAIQTFVRQKVGRLLVELHQLAEAEADDGPSRVQWRDVTRRLEEAEERSARLGDYLQDRLRQIAAVLREERPRKRDTDFQKPPPEPTR